MASSLSLNAIASAPLAATSPSEQFERDFKRAYLSSELDPHGNSSSFQRSQTLGFGTSGAVFKVTNTDLSTTHALKCLSKIRPREKFANEVRIMQDIGYHPNIVSLVYAYEDKNYYNIVMELCRGGELTDVLIRSPFTEQQASFYIRQILSALNHCHERNIVHRDIKPGNFIVQEREADRDNEISHSSSSLSSSSSSSLSSSSSSPPVLKMIDFGTALKVRDDEVVKGRAGTLLYSAPELFSDKYRRGRTGQVLKAADMWSLGVLLFVMVCGRPPFEASNSDDLIDAIVAGKYEFPPSLAMSDSVKDLLSRLLTLNPQDRLTAKQALKHPWVERGANVPIAGEVLVSLEAFVTRSKLKKLVGKVMANQLTVRDENYLMSIFTRFDRDGDGRLGKKELTDFMRHLGHNTMDSELEASMALNLYSHSSSNSSSFSRRSTHSGLLTLAPSFSCPDSSNVEECSSNSTTRSDVSSSHSGSSSSHNNTRNDVCGNNGSNCGSCSSSNESDTGNREEVKENLTSSPSSSSSSSFEAPSISTASLATVGPKENQQHNNNNDNRDKQESKNNLHIEEIKQDRTNEEGVERTENEIGKIEEKEVKTNEEQVKEGTKDSSTRNKDDKEDEKKQEKAEDSEDVEEDLSTALIVHPSHIQETKQGLSFAGFEEMYTTGRLSVSSKAVLESFNHFDRGQKGYISRMDLEKRASVVDFPHHLSNHHLSSSSSSPLALSSSASSPSSLSLPRLLKRSRSASGQEDEEETSPLSPKIANQVPVVLNAVESSEDGKLSFVEWVLAMQEVDLPVLLSQHLQPSHSALVLAYLGRSVVLSKLNFLQNETMGAELHT